MTALLAAVAWLAAVAFAAPRIGRRLHRAGHAHGERVTDDCPAWCLRERAADLRTPR